MPAIAATSMLGSGVRTVTEATLDGSTDSFVYHSDKKSILNLRNPTGGALTPTIVGSAATSVGVAGIGNVTVSGGYAVGSIGAGVAKSIPLDTINDYLVGTISITGGTGLVATLQEF